MYIAGFLVVHTIRLRWARSSYATVEESYSELASWSGIIQLHGEAEARKLDRSGVKKKKKKKKTCPWERTIVSVVAILDW